MCGAGKAKRDWWTASVYRMAGTITIQSSILSKLDDGHATRYRKHHQNNLNSFPKSTSLWTDLQPQIKARSLIMTAPAPPTIPETELVSPTFKPQEISFPLPKALHTTGHIHLSFLKHCAIAYLVTSTPGDSAGSVKPVGSFVYAMPDVSSLFVIFLLPSCSPCLSLPRSICLTTT